MGVRGVRVDPASPDSDDCGSGGTAATWSEPPFYRVFDGILDAHRTPSTPDAPKCVKCVICVKRANALTSEGRARLDGCRRLPHAPGPNLNSEAPDTRHQSGNPIPIEDQPMPLPSCSPGSRHARRSILAVASGTLLLTLACESESLSGGGPLGFSVSDSVYIVSGLVARLPEDDRTAISSESRTWPGYLWRLIL